jgi:very-short-patch-repair endonuclease
MAIPLFNRHTNLERRKELRREMTFAEKVFWHCVRDNGLGMKFRRQVGVGAYIADFYVPKARLVIELDGSIHDSEDAQAYDRERDTYMMSLGLKVLRFSNEDVTDRLDEVLKRTKTYLSDVTPSPYEGEGRGEV